MKQAYIIGGPNGSGKTVLAKELTKELVLPFINADEIALTLAPAGDIAKVRVKAGKLFLGELTDHIRKGRSFVVETTLAGRNFAEIIKNAKARIRNNADLRFRGKLAGGGQQNKVKGRQRRTPRPK